MTIVSASEMRQWKRKDPVMSRVLQFVLHGWPPQQTDPAFQPYTVRKTELSVQDGCVLWGSDVMVPPPEREALLGQLHHGHPGITRMKALARSYFWWPKLDADIESVVKGFMNRNGIEHITSAPYHPSSNASH